MEAIQQGGIRSSKQGFEFIFNTAFLVLVPTQGRGGDRIFKSLNESR